VQYICSRIALNGFVSSVPQPPNDPFSDVMTFGAKWRMPGILIARALSLHRERVKGEGPGSEVESLFAFPIVLRCSNLALSDIIELSVLGLSAR